MENEEYPLAVDVHRAARAVADGATLLDVREPEELAYCRVEGCLAIPMGQVPHRLADIPRDRELYVLCHHGMRSGRVTEFLRQQGFPKAINVTGGIHAWSLHVDPEIPRY